MYLDMAEHDIESQVTSQLFRVISLIAIAMYAYVVASTRNKCFTSSMTVFCK